MKADARRSCYDYIIVGAGPAACVLALRLTANPLIRVLVLEAGRSGWRSPVLRVLARFTSWPAAQRWDYETVPQPGMKGRRIYVPQGRALGGGSAINGMTYVRGHPSDYSCWEAAGNAGWGPDAVMAAFKRIEHNHAIRDRFHGQEGPLHVADQVDPHLLTLAFVEAASEIGVPANRDFNGSSQDGVGTYQVTQLHGRRCSAADAFLQPARRRRNLTVLTAALATKVLVENGRASGVEFLRSGRKETAYATAEVVLSGGAIHTPKLLLLSGIGPADELRALNIPVVLDLPGVGRNLQDHLNVQVISRCTKPITYDHWDRPMRFLAYALEYLMFGTGIAVSNLCEGGAFLRSHAPVAAPDIQLHFMPVIWLNYGRTRVDGHGMTLEAAGLRPESRGRVTLATSDPLNAPLIDPQYCAELPDVQVLVHAIRRCRDIMSAPALDGLASSELYPGRGVRSDEELADYVRESGTTAYHQVGTCKMGLDHLAVVDPRLRVRGLEALRVIDSSIMPRIVSGSTQAPAMMIGEMGATMILADRG